jgi:hypothetical protein
LKSVGREGTKIDGQYEQLSGDPFTAILNSIRNLFMHYRAYRGTKVEGIFLSPEEAWQRILDLVIVGGDDGGAGDMEEGPVTSACKSVGQVLEYEFVKVGDPGVNFLARYYTRDVWYGDINTCCDLKRQIIKFHLSSPLANSVTPLEKLKQKAISFNLSDGNSPLFGPYCKRVLELTSDVVLTKESESIRTWISTQGPVPNDVRVDYWELLQNQLPNVAAAYDDFLDWLDRCQTATDLLSPILLQPMEAPKPHPTVAVVVDGMMLQPSAPIILEEEEKTNVNPEPKKPSLVEKVEIPTKTTPKKKAAPLGTKTKLKPVHVPVEGVDYVVLDAPAVDNIKFNSKLTHSYKFGDFGINIDPAKAERPTIKLVPKRPLAEAPPGRRG